MSLNKTLLNSIVEKLDKPTNMKAGANNKAIIDPRGQWAHPGENTIVPTEDGHITMQGVFYPVYGVDETGYGQWMLPGEQYQFPGQMVYETPIMGDGGQMIRRADGSYSKRGLWDNIRANKGSGKKPTKEMLEQERKIKAEEKQFGGTLLNDKSNPMYFQKGGSKKSNDVKLNPTQEYYANQMFQKYGKVVMTDKANNMTYYGTKRKDGTWDLNAFEVLSGANNNPQDQFISGYSLKEMEKMNQKDKHRQKVTPIGVFGMTPTTVYGYPGYNLGNSSIAYHATYEGADDKTRKYLYNNNNPQDNYKSYGCINCEKPSINALTKFVGNEGVAAIIDSRLSAEENSKWMRKNTPSLGFVYQTPKSPMPGNKQATVAAAKRTSPVVAKAAVPAQTQGQIAANTPGFKDMSSIVDFLNHVGIDSSKANRAEIAQRMGIKDYDYSANKNTELLNLLKRDTAAVSKMPQTYMTNGGYVGYDGKRHVSNTPTWSGNMGYAYGGYTPEAMYGGDMMADGGPFIGREMDVTPEQLEMLRQQGYQFEIM